MNRGTILTSLQAAAKKCKVNPKFLLLAVEALYKNPDATEADIKQRYFDAFVADLKEADSRPPKRRKKGEVYPSYFLPIRGSFLDEYFTDEQLDKIKAFLSPNELVLHAHSLAYNHLHGDLYRLHRKWKEAGVKPIPPNEADAVQVVKGLFPELIEQYRDFIEVVSTYAPGLN